MIKKIITITTTIIGRIRIRKLIIIVIKEKKTRGKKHDKEYRKANVSRTYRLLVRTPDIYQHIAKLIK